METADAQTPWRALRRYADRQRHALAPPSRSRTRRESVDKAPDTLFPHEEDNRDPEYLAAQIIDFQHALNERLNERAYAFAGVDTLAALLDAHLKKP